MERKIHHIFTLLAVAFLSLNFAFAGSTPRQTSTRLYELLKDSEKKRVPPQRFIQCDFVNDMIFFEPNFEYEYMDAEVISTGQNGIIEGKFTIYEPYIITHQLSGECTIRCTTDAGAVYEGTINL